MRLADRHRLQPTLEAAACVTFSPFVLRAHDSESPHADPSGTSLALSNRLARNQSDRTLPASGRPLRTLQAPAWPLCCATRRVRWRLVGRGGQNVARWTRSSAPPLPAVHRPRCCPHDAQTGLPRDGSFEPRPELQRTALAKSRCALSALPHDSRRPGTSSTPVVECVSATCARGPLHRSLSLISRCVARARTMRPSGASRTEVSVRSSEARLPFLLRLTLTGARGHGRTLSDRKAAPYG